MTRLTNNPEFVLTTKELKMAESKGRRPMLFRYEPHRLLSMGVFGLVAPESTELALYIEQYLRGTD